MRHKINKVVGMIKAEVENEESDMKVRKGEIKRLEMEREREEQAKRKMERDEFEKLRRESELEAQRQRAREEERERELLMQQQLNQHRQTEPEEEEAVEADEAEEGMKTRGDDAFFHWEQGEEESRACKRQNPWANRLLMGQVAHVCERHGHVYIRRRAMSGKDSGSHLRADLRDVSAAQSALGCSSQVVTVGAQVCFREAHDGRQQNAAQRPHVADGAEPSKQPAPARREVVHLRHVPALAIGVEAAVALCGKAHLQHNKAHFEHLQRVIDNHNWLSRRGGASGGNQDATASGLDGQETGGGEGQGVRPCCAYFVHSAAERTLGVPLAHHVVMQPSGAMFEKRHQGRCLRFAGNCGVLAAESVPAEVVIVHSIDLAASTPSYLQVLTPGQGVSNSSLCVRACARVRVRICSFRRVP